MTVWEIGDPDLNDYAAKQWSGLTKKYYRERFAIFVEALENATRTGSFNEADMNAKMLAFENSWQYEGFSNSSVSAFPEADLEDTVRRVQRDWTAVFSVEG